MCLCQPDVTRLSHPKSAHSHVGEDYSQVRCGSIPQVMTELRNTIIGLVRWMGHTNIATACRYLAARPRGAMKAVGIQRKTK
jgi:hypothetical protein